MNTNTIGVVLSSYNSKEADRLYRIYTSDLGKITCIGKGVRKIRSRRGPHIDTLNLVELTLFEKNSYYYITGSSLVNDFKNLKANLPLLSWSSYIVEALNLLTIEEEPDIVLFNHLRNALTRLDKEPSKRDVYKFLMLLIKKQGFWDDSFFLEHSYLNTLTDTNTVSKEDQALIDKFFLKLVESITERKINSFLLLQ